MARATGIALGFVAFGLHNIRNGTNKLKSSPQLVVVVDLVDLLVVDVVIVGNNIIMYVNNNNNNNRWIYNNCSSLAISSEDGSRRHLWLALNAN